ncbi:hypothetical protein THASP1DRAFT_23674 [Thamnocephalis sphaerospora]|uniref:Uncharacterized protein n=1 Tax=Thamnocephalis sphaerospora TaxID=78915 RepID=A0A4P9XQJ4_9FUNG|nr:hypothetical protein THASP1DRAFT_23674 [Thamnocephalis sphaerospora]|eukprot:RKP08298.1 hypothetical protein THASP1DRAFT_23674 [Thamnocephalis sphaerospora]
MLMRTQPCLPRSCHATLLLICKLPSKWTGTRAPPPPPPQQQQIASALEQCVTDPQCAVRTTVDRYTGLALALGCTVTASIAAAAACGQKPSRPRASNGRGTNGQQPVENAVPVTDARSASYPQCDGNSGWATKADGVLLKDASVAQTTRGKRCAGCTRPFTLLVGMPHRLW